MIPEIGHYALVLALLLAIVQSVFPLIGAARRDPAWMGLAAPAAHGQLLMVTVAFAALTQAYVTSDFSVLNVVQNSHSDKPMLYKISGVWGNHEGSLVLWVLMLALFGSAVAAFGSNLPPTLKARVLAVQGMIGVGFLAFMLGTSNPFIRVDPAPLNGQDLNPLLQDPGLAFHPPFLYLGYVGFSMAFSFAAAALIEGKVDPAWARWVRPWTLIAWSSLTLGIAMGSWWAYYELGWGGWWFWDPVENASFMPWLVGAALLHSAIVTEKRGALVGWTVFLALAAFSFSMLGAFLVRSGVLTSVHAFAVDPARGLVLLAILGVTAGSGFALFAWRAPAFAPGGVFAPISRESSLVLNNLFLAAATATVLLGTLYPLMLEAATGETISVGPAYFNLTFAPLMAAAALILPAGPLLAWKRGDLKGVIQRLTAAAGLAIAAAVLTYALVEPRKAFGAVGVGIGAWLVLGALAEVIERARVGRARAGEVWRRLKGLPRGAWGMTLGHLGLGVFVLGACVETGWKQESAEVLAPGRGLEVGGYALRLDRAGAVDGPNYLAERASVSVSKDGSTVCTAEPERRFFPAGGQTTSEVALCFRGLSDLYVVLGERRATAAGEPGWLVRAYWNPWARLIFLGPLLMAAGGLVSLSDRRLRLGVAARRAAASAKAEAAA